MKALRKPLSLFMAMLMCLGIFAGTGTTAFAAGETMTTYMVEFPRASDPNKAGWGHSAMNFLGGWSTGENNGFTIHTQDSFNGKVIYCIEPGVGVHSGDQFTGRGEDFWDDYPSDLNPTIPPDTIKEYIGRIMTYGWQGNASTSWMTDDPEDASKMAGAIATQLLVWEALSQMGFTQGNILEPSCGTGNFLGLLPADMAGSKAYGVELDSISGRIAQQLYQNASVSVNGFETVQMPDSFFDVAVGNVPFGDFKVLDRRYDKHHWLIHDYFFGKALDKVRPGGVIAFVTSKGTMDKENSAVRRYLAQRADLIGAIRLPDNTFKRNAGTEVTSDVIFLQKRDHITDLEPDWVHLNTDENGIRMNCYFVQHPEMILGDMVMESTRFGPDSACKAREGEDLSEQLANAVQFLQAEIKPYELEELDEEEDKSIPADPNVKNFSYTIADGQVYYRENSLMHPVEVSVTAENRIRGMIELRECVRRLIEYQTEGYPDEEISAEQQKLNALYDSFTAKYGLINSRGNKLAFSEDSSYCLLCSLEVLDEQGNLKRKADMFTRRTIRPHVAVTSVDTASEALAVSISEKARVDMDYMAELSGKSPEELERELAGVIYRDIRCAENPEDILPSLADLGRYAERPGFVRSPSKRCRHSGGTSTTPVSYESPR